MATQKNGILAKFYLVAAFMTLFLVFVMFRVFNLQYAHGDKYRKLSKDLTVREFTISANKGNVYAADGNLLATSLSKFTIRMDLVAVQDKVFEENIVETLNDAKEYFRSFIKNDYNKSDNFELEVI